MDLVCLKDHEKMNPQGNTKQIKFALIMIGRYKPIFALIMISRYEPIPYLRRVDNSTPVLMDRLSSSEYRWEYHIG